jgi:hypothetical protein
MHTDIASDPAVLVIAEDESISAVIDLLMLGRARIEHAYTPEESDGVDVGVVVIAMSRPVDELKAIRVHPQLSSVPVVVLDASRSASAADIEGPTWVIDTTQLEALDELTERVGTLHARSLHPSADGRSSGATFAA